MTASRAAGKYGYAGAGAGTAGCVLAARLSGGTGTSAAGGR